MATELLQASLDETTVTRTLEHDLEALCWVIVYAIYMHALGETKGETRRKLRGEFATLFSAISIEKLLHLRGLALGGSRVKIDENSKFKGIRVLHSYVGSVDEDLTGLLELIWALLQATYPDYRRADLTVLSKYRQHLPEISRHGYEAPKPIEVLTHERLLEYIGLVVESKS